jgi:microcystin degradation protein MlrC
MAASEIPVAYWTNPHRDHASTGHRAGSLLIRTLRGEIRPTSAWRSLPMLLGGGTTLDVLPPMLGVFAKMRWNVLRRRALSMSAFTCHLWNDDPDLGWSAVALTDGDRATAEALADELAEQLWATRHHAPPRFPSIDEAIAEARGARLARKAGVVVMCDASDVVSAGAPGENTRILAGLLAAGDLRSLVPLRDPAIVDALWDRAVGSKVKITVGGKLDPTRNSGLEIEGTLARTQRMAGYQRMAVVDAGPVTLVLTEGPAFVIKPSFYGDLGLSVWGADVVVVKNFFPFRLFFAPMARKTIYVRTEGVTDFDAAYALSFRDAMHPRDPVDDWRPADRRRRGLDAG